MSGTGRLAKPQKFFWALFLISLPVTSFPFFPPVMGGGALVRPLSLYPLAVLLLLLVFTRQRARPLPRTLIPLLVFVLAAVAATALGLMQGIEPAIDISFEERAARMLVTLFLGVAFYLVVAMIPSSEAELEWTLRFLYLGLGIALVWASFQAVYVLHFDRPYFRMLNQVQRLISIRKLFTTRISGLTYEPSWFAEQIAFLYLPWLTAAIISRKTVFPSRWRGITVEHLLWLWAAAALFLTFSRGGVAMLVVQVLLAVMLFPRHANGPRRSWGTWLAKRGLQITLALLVLALVIFAIGRTNNYFSRLWGYWTDEEGGVGTYMSYIAASQRLAYWETAFRIFQDHPWTGTGLGSFTFYFGDYLPERDFRDPELFYKLVPGEGRNQVVTVKNLFFRLLAETGLVGMAAFTSFLVASGGCVLYLLLSADPAQKYWGRAGVLGLGTFLVATVSVDSFAIPNMWVFFGLLTASASVFRQADGGVESPAPSEYRAPQGEWHPG